MHGRVAAQASMLDYNNIFKMMLIIAVMAIPLAFVFRKPDAPQQAVAPAK